jgi:outer membrane protein OmpA-like peptidoglycan-associated protein
MKKIILTEEQLKRVIDNVVTEQTLTKTSEQITQNAWYLCGYYVLEQNGRYYVTDGSRTGTSTEIPFRDQLQGTIVGRGRRAVLEFDELTGNAVNIGNELRQEMRCGMSSPPMQTVGKDGWICYMVRDGKEVVGNKYVDMPIFPAFGAFSVDNRKVMGSRVGGLGVERYPDESVSPAKTVKQIDGAIVQYRKTKTEDFVFEISPALSGDFLERKKETPKPTPPPPTKPPVVVQLDIQSPFEFDKVTLTPEAEQKFSLFIQNMKANYQGTIGDVEVICSASIDADPAKKASYNQKLSENRALTIVNRLKAETGITTMNFIPKGIGQTSQFAPNLKWPEVTDETKTAPNRRLIIKLPQITKQTK